MARSWNYMKYCRRCEELKQHYAKFSKVCCDCADKGRSQNNKNRIKPNTHIDKVYNIGGDL